MAYLDTRNRPNPAGMAAVIAIHAAVGAALVIGLSVSGVIEKDEVFSAIPLPKPSPPPEPPKVEPRQPDQAKPDIYVPTPPLPFPTRAPFEDTTNVIPTPTPRPGPGPSLTPQPLPTVTPSFAPIAAKPRNDPLRWVTTDDYRSNWIRQEMTGKARFRLEIAADGRVAGCTVTGSSGHPELDAATCALVSRRAKFQPARGSEGEPVAGSYSNAIDWRLPE